ncbi:ABC transporter substrate-binding protein [Pseudomonas fluorescens BBc6R8]|uniref:ABC transporter substrate-binding protein n=1 Tax=Pseudomonas fluorescens TaxID=294 RepID=UPI000281CCB7|nr:ABC transporter substrate-binding protein [Pseudomonas fluorescens]QQD55845.1 ABC transporter substrate-binding protein [Pseudomonas fluorescens BBc6R8]
MTPSNRKTLALSLLCAALSLGAWQSASAAAPKDTLMIGKAADPQTLDPAVTIDNNDWAVTYPAYQKLVAYKVENGKGSTEVKGDLADSWTTSADGLVWDFKLKPGNKFDDGAEVDANAVKFSFDRVMQLKQGPSGAFPDDMKVTVVDPLTVRFTLAKPYAPFLYTLAHNGAGIINPDVVKQGDVNAYLSTHTAGSGAFRLSNWQKGQSLTLEPNTYYAGTKPALNKVVIKIISEASVRRLQLERGDLDIAEDMPQDQLTNLAKKKDVVIKEFPSLRVTYLYLNNQKAPLNNQNARQAIVDAVDYKGIVDGILKGQAKLMNGPIPAGMWANDPSLPMMKQDLDSAGANLKKLPEKITNLNYMYSDKDPDWESIGLTLQASLAPLGINLKMEKLANATMRERLGKGDFDVSIGSWAPDFSDPYMYMNFWFDSSLQGLPGNRSFYSNPVVDKLIRDAAANNDTAKRTELYQEAQKIVLKDSVYAYLYQKNYTLPMRDSVKGYVFHPMLEQVFNVAEISK